MRAYDLSALSALIVEPDTLLRRVLTDMLFAFGLAKVDAAVDPASAWARLDETSVYDLILTELDFEGHDGAELIRDIRQHPVPAVRMQPLIALTLDARIDRVAMARDCGATEFLAKPIFTTKLYDRIVMLIERPRPFIHVPNRYFGPDRRRSFQDFLGEERRAPAAAHA